MLEFFTYKMLKGSKGKEKEKQAGASSEVPKIEEPSVAHEIFPGGASAGSRPDIRDGTATPILSEDDENFLAELITTAETPPVLIVNKNGAQSGDGTLKAGTVQGVAAKVVASDKDAQGTENQKSTEDKSADKDKKAKDQTAAIAYGKEVGEYLRKVFAKDKDKNSVDKKKEKGKEKAKEDTTAAVDESSKVKGDKGKEVAKAENEDENEFAEVLEQLNLASKDGKLFSRSPDYKNVLRKFTQILKDINNGVPTAYNDLIDLFDTSSSTFSKVFESLPKSLQKLITQTLPSKLTPEVLRTLAAASPELASEAEKGAALGLKELISKPGLVAGLLKSVISILKTRFPLLMGGGMAAGMGITIVMMILWYCYKRGKETRLEEEALASGTEDSVAAVQGAPSSVGEGSSGTKDEKPEKKPEEGKPEGEKA